MPLETWGPESRIPVLNVNWPAFNDSLSQGDDHLRLIKTTLSNFYNDLITTGELKVLAAEEADHADSADRATNADSASDSVKLGGFPASEYVKRNGTYTYLRAQATTKSDVGLGNVQNFGASDSYTLNSSTTYATSKALHDAFVVLNGPGAIAGVGTIGTYGLFTHTSAMAHSVVHAPGTTVAGSQLRYSNVNGEYGLQHSPAGTWRRMGYTTNQNATTPSQTEKQKATTLFVRVL